jgi:hypothetical protein
MFEGKCALIVVEESKLTVVHRLICTCAGRACLGTLHHSLRKVKLLKHAAAIHVAYMTKAVADKYQVLDLTEHELGDGTIPCTYFNQ